MGGGAKPSGSTTTVQKADPWEGQQPYLNEQFQAAQSLFNKRTPQYNQDAYNKALESWNTANAGQAPQYDMNAYNAAFAGWKGGGSKPQSAAEFAAERGLNPVLSDTRNKYADYTYNFKPTPSGPQPTMEQFLIPGAAGARPKLEDFALPGTENSSALAPAYYPGQTIANQSPETLLAQQLTTQRALAGSPITNTASGLLTDTLKGRYLDPATNPGFKQGMTDIADTYRTAIAPQTDAAFAKSGAYGGSAYNEAVGRNQRGLADSLNKYAGELYDTERNRQMQSMLFAPQAAAQDYADLSVLSGVGGAKEARSQDLINEAVNRYNYNANLPANALRNYIDLTSGSYGSTQTATTPYYSNQGAGMLGGALSGGLFGAQNGAGIAGMLGSSTPWLYGGPTGALVGGGLGLLGSLF